MEGAGDATGTLDPAALAAAKRVLAAGGTRGLLGVVLGTGLGGLVNRLADPVLLPAGVTGWLAPSSATGHAGRIACGTVGGCPLVMLQGRVHAYEGFDDATISRGVQLLAALGARTVLLTNASGGLRGGMRSGELLVIDDHLDLVRRPTDSPTAPPRRARRGYDRRLVDLALAAARRVGASARPGVYARLLGPTYETRAEYRMLVRLGADVAGMSTVPEVCTAWRLGIGVVAVSVITNVANPDAPEETDAAEVCRLAAGATDGVWSVIGALVDDVGAGGAVGRSKAMTMEG